MSHLSSYARLSSTNSSVKSGHGVLSQHKYIYSNSCVRPPALSRYGAAEWYDAEGFPDLIGCVTDKPGRPFGNVGGRLTLRFVMRPSAMRTGVSKRDLHV